MSECSTPMGLESQVLQDSFGARFKLFLMKVRSDSDRAGFLRGLEHAEKQIRLNRILIPLSLAAFPAGVLLQRYFLGV